MFSNEILFVAAASLGLCWAMLSSWVLGSRYIYDRALLRRARDVERLEADSLQVRDLSPRRLRRIAVGPLCPASTIAACALVRDEESALLQRAAGGGRKSARIRALTIVARAGSPRALGLLRDAVGEEDTSIVAGAVRLASELTTRGADILLLDVLLAGRHPRSRTATELEPRSGRIRQELLALVEHPEAAMRFWAVTLLGRAPRGTSITSAVAHRASDLDPSVRAAAAEALGKADSDVSRPILRRLLEDNVFYVRAHAARGIGVAGTDELTGDVAALLADTNWWVRAAAKESLLALGVQGFKAAVVALEHEDRFARDGALEIIVGSVHLQSLLTAADAGDPGAKAVAATIAIRRAGSVEAHRVADTPGTLDPSARAAA